MQNTIQLIIPDGRKYFFIASSPEDREIWLNRMLGLKDATENVEDKKDLLLEQLGRVHLFLRCNLLLLNEH